MIRPEYVELEPQGTPGENRVPGMVEEVVYLGFHQDVRVRLANGSLVRADVPNDGTAPDYDQGDAVSVHLRRATCACSRPIPTVAPGRPPSSPTARSSREPA